VVAKPDRTIKIPGVSPDGSLVRSPVPAFRFTGVIPLLWPRLSHSTPDTQFREGSSLQAGLYARTPVQSDCCALTVTIILSPTRKDTTKRHWQQPLVTDCERVSLEVMAGLSYTERTVLVTRLAQASYLVKSSPTNLTFEKPPPGGFFVFRARDYDDTNGISRRSLTNCSSLHYHIQLPSPSIKTIYNYGQVIPLTGAKLPVKLKTLNVG
jgi:hypothetical protein